MPDLSRLALEVAVAELEVDVLHALAAAGFPTNLTRAPTRVEVLSRTTFAGIEGDVDQTSARAIAVALAAREEALRLVLVDLSAEATGTQDVLRRLDALAGHALTSTALAEVVDAAAGRLLDVYREGQGLAAERIVRDARAAGVLPIAPVVLDEAVAVAQARRVAADAVDAGVRAVRGAAHSTPRPPSTTVQGFLRTVADTAADVGTKGLEDVATQGALAANGAGRTGGGATLAADGTTWYASELLDRATCGPCSSVDGREYATREDALADYPSGRYVGCKGGDRCRGTLIAVAASEVAPSLRVPADAPARVDRPARTA